MCRNVNYCFNLFGMLYAFIGCSVWGMLPRVLMYSVCEFAVTLSATLHLLHLLCTMHLKAHWDVIRDSYGHMTFVL